MAQNSSDDRRPGLCPPRFRLSTLLWLIAFLGAVFAMMGMVGPYGVFALTLLVLSVFAHVAGNAIGTSLIENGDRPLSSDGKPIPIDPSRFRKPSESEYAPINLLGRQVSLGLIVFIITTSGVIIGAVGGGSFLTIVNWQRVTLPAMLFAVLFSSILGGFVGFVTSSFVKVLVAAQLEALNHSRRR